MLKACSVCGCQRLVGCGFTKACVCGVSKACVWVFKALRQKITSNSEVTAYYETFVLEDTVALDDLKAAEQVRIALNNRKRSKPVLFCSLAYICLYITCVSL